MTGCEQDEYSALRATIGQRGTARVWTFLAGISAWAALFVTAATLALPPVDCVAPLLVLAAAFEGVYALHVGVERIGRYLQVFYETEPGTSAGTGRGVQPGWEHTAMRFGRPPGSAGAGVDPLFALVFVLAAFLNLFAANLIAATRAEIVFVLTAHGLFLARVARARSFAGKQRAIDLARFEQLKAAPPLPSRNTAS